jgi:hypothetical protein
MIRKGSLRNTGREPHGSNSNSRSVKRKQKHLGQEGKAHLFMFLRDKNLERGGWCYEPMKYGTVRAYQMQATGARQVGMGRTGVPRSRV